MPQPLIHVSDLTKEVTSLYRKHFFDFLRILIWLLVPTVLSALLPLFPISKLSKIVIDASLSLLMVILSLWLSVTLVDLVGTYAGKTNAKKLKQGIWAQAGRVVDFTLISLLQAAVIFIGFLLFVIPGFIFLNWFSFARYAVLIDESSPGSEALRLSKNLVNGRFWSIAWRWIGSYLYFGSFLVLVTIALVALVGALLGDPGLGLRNGQPVWWSTLIVSVFSVLVTPIFIAVGVLLYEDAKRTK
ncbi:hypothetical protein HY628_03165 [Candidatus Uhrbacteria bacterium]|nr:hypothetical protein [Candidatus Uhrbacteria bacterium]